MLPSLTASFLLGLVIGAQILLFPVVLLIVLLFLASGVTFLERAAVIDSRRAVIAYAVLLSGVVYWNLVTPIPVSHHPQPNRRDIPLIEVSGRIVSPVQYAPGRLTVLLEADGSVMERYGQGDSSRVRLVWREPGHVLLHGDRIRFRAKLHPPTGSLNPGGFDYAGYLERQGIDAVTSVTGSEAV